MMKKWFIASGMGMLVVALSASMAFAAEPAGSAVMGQGRQGSCLTDSQRQEMQPLLDKMQGLHGQMMEVRQQMLQKQVSWGNLTQEQADQRLARMKDRMGNASRAGNGHGRFCQGTYKKQMPSDNAQ